MPPTPTTNFHGTGVGGSFIPEATGAVQVEFSRNPDSFALNQYARIIPGVAAAGYYPEFDTQDAIRIVTSQDYQWPDGNSAPRGENRELRWKSWTTLRYSYPWELGERALRNAMNVSGLDLASANARMVATKAMTARSYSAVTALAGASWGSNTSATVDALLGGSGESWTVSTVANSTIENSFRTVAQQIHEATGGVVGPSALCCVVSPAIARQMALTAEIVDYRKAHNQTWSLLNGYQRDILNKWGLPPYIAGIRMCVEDAVRISTRKGISVTDGYLTGNSAYFLARVDGVSGTPGGLTQDIEGYVGPNLSTLVGFVEDDMLVEQRDDRWNKRVEGRVVDTYDFEVAAPISGYYIADVTT